MVEHCLIINMDHRTDLWKGLDNFRENWKTHKKQCTRIVGTNYANKQNVLNEYITNNRINLNGNGFRNNKKSFLGELGCYNGHYDCWKYIVDNNLASCLILEDGIAFMREDYQNLLINPKLDVLFVNEEMKIDAKKQFIGYGLQGYVVSLKGAKSLLKLCFTLIAPIDLQIRHLCNTKELNASVVSKPFVKREHNRASSIEGAILNDQADLNAKQNPSPIIQRILMNLISQNVNLDEYV